MRRLLSRNNAALAAIVISATIAAYVACQFLPVLIIAENWFTDLRITLLSAKKDQNQNIVLVTITDETLAALPYRSPTDRALLANVLRHVDSAGPRVIGLDFFFDQPTEPQKDQYLLQTLRTLASPLVVTSVDRFEVLSETQKAYHNEFTIGLQSGLANLVFDRLDGVVRWIFPGEAVATKFQPGFAVAVADAAGIVFPKPTKNDLLAYSIPPEGPLSAFPRFPAHIVKNLPRAWLAGKIVLIGSDLPEMDRHRTPFVLPYGEVEGSLPGLALHGYAIAQFLDGRTIRAMSVPQVVFYLLTAALCAVVIAKLNLGWLASSGAYAAIAFVILASGWMAYGVGGTLLPTVPPLLSLVLASGMATAHVGRLERKQKKFIRETFSKYVSPKIVRQLLADPAKIAAGGQRRELTYIFTDMEGFTGLTERTAPNILIPFINEYLAGMCRIIVEHEGTIDKLIGDAVVGFFNAPTDQPDHRKMAVACALALDDFGQRFKEQALQRGLEIGVTRIGVHSGEATVGNFGGDAFFDYTAQGDMVNIASRLEGANKYLGTRICVSEEAAKGCSNFFFRPVGVLVLKGKAQGIKVFEPVPEAQSNSDAYALYLRAYDLLGSGDNQAAGQIFSELQSKTPQDGLVKFHAGRLGKGMAGVVIKMEEK